MALKHNMGLLPGGKGESPRRLNSGKGPVKDAEVHVEEGDAKGSSDAELLKEFERLEGKQ
jgi:hypothetical protein